MISAFSVLIPIGASIWKRHEIWRKFSLLILFLITGGITDFISYQSMKLYGSNTIISNIYQIVEFVILIWMFNRWPTKRKSRFHSMIILIGIIIWIIDFCIINSLKEYSPIFRVFGSMLIVFVCIDQINYTILNRENSIIISRMLIKIGFVLYFFYKALVESFDLLHTDIQYTYSDRFWFIQNSLSILLNIFITIAFLCYRSKPTRSILT